MRDPEDPALAVAAGPFVRPFAAERPRRRDAPRRERERAVLDFNRRVLAQARRADVPLLERLRYVCIVSSNLDEFFEVRLADYLEAAHPGAADGDLEAIAADAHALVDRDLAQEGRLGCLGKLLPTARAEDVHAGAVGQVQVG
ncbi:MAG TPA: hypothetical protein VLU41_11810, partial [Ideonella sp.]|nr:hypothetical protein [Ideonella sp.]